MAAFERALQATPRPACQDTADDLDAALAELTALARELTAKMGDGAPGLSQLRQALTDCRTLAGMVLSRKGPAPAAAAEPATADAGAEVADAAGNGRAEPKRPTTREEVYGQLAAAADLLLQIEPHSPIPYLIRRAVELGKLPFPQLIKMLVRDPNVITEMNRELGITDGSGG
jgi:type VI secretion system protein ImpA